MRNEQIETEARNGNTAGQIAAHTGLKRSEVVAYCRANRIALSGSLTFGVGDKGGALAALDRKPTLRKFSWEA